MVSGFSKKTDKYLYLSKTNVKLNVMPNKKQFAEINRIRGFSRIKCYFPLAKLQPLKSRNNNFVRKEVVARLDL